MRRIPVCSARLTHSYIGLQIRGVCYCEVSVGSAKRQSQAGNISFVLPLHAIPSRLIILYMVYNIDHLVRVRSWWQGPGSGGVDSLQYAITNFTERSAQQPTGASAFQVARPFPQLPSEAGWMDHISFAFGAPNALRSISVFQSLNPRIIQIGSM
jgi:hypothetical protein